MNKVFISQENLKIFVNNLKKECHEFIAPKKEHLSDIVFGDTKNDKSELLEYEGNSVISPRAFLLPQSEELFEVTSVKQGTFSRIEDKKKRIFYGVRPCDIEAIKLMRIFFSGEFVDEFYEEKINNSIFIALGCSKLCSEKAFCYQMDAGPLAKDGFDLQLVALGNGYLVYLGSKKGSALVKKNKKLFTKAKLSDEKKLKASVNNFTTTLKRMDYKKIAKIMAEEKVKDSIWEDIALRCVVCSGCITLCPTCSCFSIADRLDGDKGLRLRYGDGCPYAGFTRMAGGNTPFPLHKDHIRRFFEHKLNVDVERYGRPSCVGCGRCIQTCPGNISIRKFIEEVEKL